MFIVMIIVLMITEIRVMSVEGFLFVDNLFTDSTIIELLLLRWKSLEGFTVSFALISLLM